MEIFTKTKKSKKMIIVIVLLLLFSFTYPKQVHAIDFLGNISSFFFLLEKGVIGLMNDIFCDDKHSFDVDNFGNAAVFFTPENIIKGKFLLLDANIFKDVSSSIDPKSQTGSSADRYYDAGFEWLAGDGKARDTLRDSISGWYYSILTFSTVALLSVLVYVGIRMVVSTIAQDKAKYKTMFKDWLVAICLLILMHYMMIGLLKITDMITDTIGTGGGGANQTARVMSLIYNINANEDDGGWWTDECEDSDDKGVKGGVEGCRYHILENGEEKHYQISDAFANEVLLIGIIVLTFIFAWKYLKREFTIIFLILLGPLSCITYPIDKISDGKAQAYNKWFSEFLYNVLIQPFHLLLYLVLCGTAVELANENIIYSLACLAILTPAEKFVKEMFGFRDKLGSPLGAMATGAAMSQLISKGSKAISGGGSSSAENNSVPARIKDKTVDNDMVSGGNSSQPAISSGSNSSSDSDSSDSGSVRTVGVGNESGNDLPEGENNAQRRMLDADAENFNGEDYDPHEQAYLENDLSQNQPQNGAAEDNRRAELEEIFREQGMTDEEIQQEMQERGYGANESAQNEEPQRRNLKAAAKGAIDKFKKSGVGQAATKLGHTHTQRMAKKWGSTSRKQRWINRGKKLGKSMIKGSAKGVSGIVAGTAALVSGKGIGGAITAGTGAAMLTDRAIDNVGGKIKGVAGDYIDGLRSDDQREKQAFNEFRADKNQQNRAVLNYRDKHDGADPSSRQLDQEMQDRFALSRFGLTDAQIDDSVGTYQQLKDEMPAEQALNQAALAAQIADRYKGKFEKESDMKSALGALTQRLGGNQQKAFEILNQAADMKGETLQLQLPKKEVELTPQEIAANNSRARLTALGVSEPTDVQIKQEIELQQDLISAGFSSDEIERLRQASGGYDRYNVIAKNSIKLKENYISGNRNIKGTIETLRGKGASEIEVNEEIMEIAEIQEMGLENLGQIEAIREMEQNISKGDRSKIVASRALGRKAKRNGGKLTRMDKESLNKDQIALAESYADIEKA